MRAAKVIVAGLVVVIVVIIFRFFSTSQMSTPHAPVVSTIPEPSQMMKAAYISSLIRVLQRNDPDVWHQVAMGWNWDGGVAPLEWMIRQSRCDLGTALLIYWRGGPGFFKQYAGRDQVPAFLSVELFDLLEEVEGRLLSGFYTRREIAFNPRRDDSYDWTTRYVDVAAERKIPEQLYEPTSGRQIVKPCVFVSSSLRC